MIEIKIFYKNMLRSLHFQGLIKVKSIQDHDHGERSPSVQVLQVRMWCQDEERGAAAARGQVSREDSQVPGTSVL